MLYEALNQPQIFLYMCLGGFFTAFIFDIKSILMYFFKKNHFFSHFFDFFACFFVFFSFFYINLLTNYGELRLFTVTTFFLSFFIQRFFVKNFVANPTLKCYNILKGKLYERRIVKSKRKEENKN